MEFTMLDASLAGLAEFLLVVSLLAVTIIEWFVMLIMKFNAPGKAILDSFLVNLASFALGYLLASLSVEIGFAGENYSGLLIGFAASIAIEGLFLQLLNKSKAPKKVWLTSIVMNAVTYTGLFLILYLN